MYDISSSVSLRKNFAGTPAHSSPYLTIFAGVRTDPAAIIPNSSTCDMSIRVLPIPINALFAIVHACMMHLCPTVTLSPIDVFAGESPVLFCLCPARVT